jgi:hypothetical protein
MANIFDYLDWRGDLSFKADPFNAVDNIVFSLLSYYPFERIVSADFGKAAVPLPVALKKLGAAIKKDPSIIQRKFVFKQEQTEFLPRLSIAERYRDCLLCGYINKLDLEREMQFAVITILAPDAPAYISFRGTDNAIVGWKEDFNMILKHAIPSQLEAVAYLNTAAKRIKGKINLGGHSKGGNLAVYAASFCGMSVQKRINTIYSNDAPGFNKAVVSSGGYKSIAEKIECYIPQSPVIGLLFEYVKNYKVVKSSEIGFMQHNLFSWELKRKEMVHTDSISKQSRLVNKTLMQWLENMNYETRSVFIETLFNLFNSANITTLSDFTGNALKNTALLIKSLRDVDKKTKAMLFKTFSALFEIAKNNIQPFLDVKTLLKAPRIAEK